MKRVFHMRSTSFLLVLLLASASLVACAGGGDDNDNDNETATSISTAIVSEAASSPAATSEATATLTMNAGSPTARPRTEASPTARLATPSVTARATATAPVRTIATQAPTTTTAATVTVDGGSAEAVTLELVQQGFSEVQAYDEVAFGFIVVNPDADNAVINTEYRVIVYEGDAELASDDGYLDYVLPGQRIGVGGSIFIPSGRNADSVVIALTPGEAAAPELDAGLMASNITYYAESVFPSATGVISTTSAEPLQDFEVFAVAYDAAGTIVGGGYTFVSFILPNGSTGVEVAVSSADEPERVELFPVVTSLTIFGLSGTSSTGAQPLGIVADGFGPSGFENELGWGIIVENPNAGLAAETTAYQTTAYAADGKVLGVYSSFISLLLPGERLGLGGSFYLPPGTTADRLEFEVLGRYFSETTVQAGFLTPVDVTYVADEFSPRVTGTIQNSLDRELRDIEVYAIAYNAGGQIIGGGFTFVDSIEAGGQAQAEVTIAVGEEPAAVEVFATVSSLSDIE